MYKIHFRFLLNIIFLSIFLVANVGSITAQQKKNIQLEDIWARGLFFGEQFEGLSFMEDDQYYSLLENDKGPVPSLVKYALSGGSKKVIIPAEAFSYQGNAIEPSGYEFSADESKVLISSQEEKIYRRSSKAFFYVYDVSTQILKPVSTEGKQSYAAFSPDGKQVAFVRDNNMFYVNLSDGKETQVTSDGILNKIINGSTDWVYEEEFEFTRAFFWSPDSRKIAFYKFDESQVKEYNMQVWSGLYPADYTYKYPKAGEKNAEVSIHCYDLATGTTSPINTGEEKDNYIPRVKWTHDPDLLSILRLNRNQNHLEVLHASMASGKVSVAYEEKNYTYIEVNDDLTYLNDGKSFLISSEKNGFRHLYLYGMDGKQINAVTVGNWEVDKVMGVDENKKRIYFTSAEISSLERYLYSIDYTGKSKKQITSDKGMHEVTMSPGFSYFIDEWSTADAPPEVRLFSAGGKVVKTLTSNDGLKGTLATYNLSATEFFQFHSAGNVAINASMIKPPGFNASAKYPVFIHLYGGPGHQTVKNGWNGPDYAWYQMLAQKGYVIVSIDNRGTGGRGAEFKKCTQHQLGKYETEDLIAAAKYLGSLSYIDKDRIGVFGWSFGGYMSSLAMTVGADYFKAGIAVAPVTSWRFYDTIYTERFLGQPKDNPSGYDDNSPLSHASKLKGAYLLIHGTGDDNVHVQNSIEMEKALIKANKQFQVFYYPDRNHGIYGGNTRLHLYTMMTQFIEKNL